MQERRKLMLFLLMLGALLGWFAIKDASFMSSELNREQALPLLVAALPSAQAEILSRGYACQVSPSMFHASTGVGDGTGLGDGRDGEVFKPLRYSTWDGAILAQMDAMHAAGIIGEITVSSGCIFPERRTHCTRTYSAPNLAMRYNPRSHNGRQGAGARYTCVLPYAELGPPEITGVSNTASTAAVVAWRRSWVVNEQARRVLETIPRGEALLLCPGCPRPGAEAEAGMTGETRFVRFDSGWSVAR